MKIKIFEDSDIDDLQISINDWLKDNPNIDILFTNQSETGFMETQENEPFGNTTISLFYKDKG